MGFGSDAPNRSVRTGFRASSNRSGTTPAHDWANYPDALSGAVQRLQGVIVECRDALQVMRQHDSLETLHYVDPPYMPETRSAKSRKGGARYHSYVHEMDASDHHALLAGLGELKGVVILSGYASEVYEAALPGWRRVERAALADGAQKRTEVLWINRSDTGDLFS